MPRGSRDDLTPERLDESHYRDDILRLLFVCGHPTLPATQQIALALRIVSGLTVEQIAKAFLVTPAAMEQRITRAKRTIAKVGVEFETPGAAERRTRLAAVSTMIYLIFNEGYGSTPESAAAREALADEAIRLGRLLLQLFPTDPEVFGLLALMLLQQSRAPARFDANGEIVLLDEQDRSLWNRALIDEGRLMLERAAIYQDPGPYQLQAAIAALHVHAARPEDTRVEGNRLAVPGARIAAAITGDDAQSRRGGVEAARSRGCAADDRAAERRAGRLFLFSRASRLRCSRN